MYIVIVPYGNRDNGGKKDGQRVKDRFIVKICITGSDWKLNQTIGRMSAENVFDADPSPTIGVDITTKKIIKYFCVMKEK